jgi:hypothetical protein
VVIKDLTTTHQGLTTTHQGLTGGHAGLAGLFVWGEMRSVQERPEAADDSNIEMF